MKNRNQIVKFIKWKKSTDIQRDSFPNLTIMDKKDYLPRGISTKAFIIQIF